MRIRVPAILLVLCSCSTAGKVEAVRDGAIAPSLSMAEDLPPADLLTPESVADTIQVKIGRASCRERVFMMV